ncbi:MAG: phosphoribosylformylglycinamidine synthase subunit PurL [Candidatus Hadarchaeales archaeon]
MSELYRRLPLPFEVYEVLLSKAKGEELSRISLEMGLAMNLREMEECKKYFSRKGRDPTDVELQGIAQTWSEHCFHKTFKGVVRVGRKRVRLFRDFIARVTEELSPSWCVSTFRDNAGIVRFDEEHGLAVKVETHNHPSAIEPFGGAATGVGGVIRDILGVWAKPIACLDVLGFGPLNFPWERLPAGIKHPRYIYRGVVAGIGAYGNNMGIPTVAGAIYFDESYVGNPVVYCGCVGILPLKRYVKKTRPGDLLVLVGGRTGRDGIHGVTFASLELSEESEEVSRPAVQIPDPIEEEKLKRGILEVAERGLASSITDLGGGGISCASGEMAREAGCGVEVWLDKVPLKYPGMRPWEIWISESQERMALSVPPEHLEEVLKIFEGEEVEATAIGKFTENGLLRVFYRGYRVAELELSFLFSPPLPERKARWKAPSLEEPSFSPPPLKRTLLRLLSSPNICSREEVIRTYDHEVQGGTVLKPLQGEYGGPNDGVVLKPLRKSRKGVVLSCGLKPRYGKIDPYWMAASSLEEAVRNNVAVGGRRIALLDNFVWGNPEKEEQLGSLLRACEACYRFALALGTPFISGKDSLYNESPLGPVTPTLLITAVGLIEDVGKAVSSELKEGGNPLYLVGNTFPELGGSEYYALLGYLGRSVPKVRVGEARRNLRVVEEAIELGLVRACHDLSEGGLGVALAEMVLGGDCGAEVELELVPSPERLREDYLFFSESNSRFLLEVKREKEEEFRRKAGKRARRIGWVTDEGVLRVLGRKERWEVDAEELRRAWRNPEW